MVGNECFFGHNFAGGSGGSTDEPKAEPKMVVRSKVLRNNYLEGLLHTFPSSMFCPPLQCNIYQFCKELKFRYDSDGHIHADPNPEGS